MRRMRFAEDLRELWARELSPVHRVEDRAGERCWVLGAGCWCWCWVLGAGGNLQEDDGEDAGADQQELAHGAAFHLAAVHVGDEV